MSGPQPKLLTFDEVWRADALIDDIVGKSMERELKALRHLHLTALQKARSATPYVSRAAEFHATQAELLANGSDRIRVARAMRHDERDSMDRYNLLKLAVKNRFGEAALQALRNDVEQMREQSARMRAGRGVGSAVTTGISGSGMKERAP